MPIIKDICEPRTKKKATHMKKGLTIRLVNANLEYQMTRKKGSYEITLASVGRHYGVTKEQLVNFRAYVRAGKRKTQFPDE